MNKVRIVGGGLMGAAAALEAHRLGARDIVLHTRRDGAPPGGDAQVAEGLEMRSSCTLFGGGEDPLRRLLEWHGAPFEGFRLECGSLNPNSRGEPLAAHGFAGLVLPVEAPLPQADAGAVSLHQRLHTYPLEARGPLTTYSQWRLRAWLDHVHASAADALGLDEARSAFAAGTPARGCGLQGLETSASLPRGGLRGLGAAARRAIENLGVEVKEGPPPAARAALRPNQREILVWTGDPAPLLSAMGFTGPMTTPDRAASYVFKARFAGPKPFVVQAFDAKGSVFRVYVYESRGETLVCAECVGETCVDEVRSEVQRLLGPFADETPRVSEHLSNVVRTRGAAFTLEAWRTLDQLARRGPGFVPGAWHRASPGARFRDISQGLAAALEAVGAARASAA